MDKISKHTLCQLVKRGHDDTAKEGTWQQCHDWLSKRAIPGSLITSWNAEKQEWRATFKRATAPKEWRLEVYYIKIK